MKQSNWFIKHKVWSVIIIGLVLLSVIIVATNGNSTQDAQSSTEASSASQTVYTLATEAKALNQDTLEVSGITNLPNDALLSIKVERSFIWEGEEAERFFNVANATAIVKDGNYSIGVKIDDKKFLNFQLTSGEPIKELKENVRVTVTFSPKAENQSQAVVSAVGANGEKLESSPQKDVFGSATANPVNRLVVEVEVPLAFPYEDQLPR